MAEKKNKAKPQLTGEELELWHELDQSLADYDRKQAFKPKPPPTKAPSWATDDIDDDAVGFTKAKPAKPAPAPEADTFGIPSGLNAAESRLEMAWKQVAQQEQDRKRAREEAEAKKIEDEKKARRLKMQEEMMEREVERAQQMADEAQAKRLKKMQKHREKAQKDLDNKRAERLKAAEEELRRRTVLEKREKKKKREEEKNDWDEQEVLLGYRGEEEKKKLEERKKNQEEKEKEEFQEARRIQRELEALRHYSPAAAKKMEEENKELLAKAKALTDKREENLGRLRAKQQLRQLQAEINAEETAKKRKENEEKQKRMIAEQLQIAQEQQRKNEEAELAMENEALGMAPVASDGPPGSRKVLDDVQRVKGMFKTIPALPACTEEQEKHCGEYCFVDDVKEVGDQRVAKLRFTDGFISYFPMLCLVGECWYELPAGWLCDVCGTVCHLTATKRPRLCAKADKVRELYEQMFQTGVLPQWNPRKVPNPRRAQCAGQECEIVEEDKLNAKVKLMFDDKFQSWFPLFVLQGAKTYAEKTKGTKY